MRLRNATIWTIVMAMLWAGPVFAKLTDGLIASKEQGWRQWRGPRRDGISDEKGLLSSWPPGGPRLIWKVEGLGTGWSSPIVVGERLYVTGDVGDDLIVFAFDRSGNPQWRAKNGKAWKGPYRGARVCCAFSEGYLCHLNADGRLYCLDESGTVALLKPGNEDLDIVGRFRLVGRRVRDAWAHPVVHDGRLYIRYHDTLWCYDVKER